MPRTLAANLKLHRAPLTGLDTDDVDAVRAWRLQAVENDATMRGSCGLRMLFVGHDFSLLSELEPTLDVDEEVGRAALFAHEARGERVRYVFREGEVSVEFDGSRRRVVVVAQVDPDTWAWWLATRRIGTNAVQIGVFHGDWETREGVGLDALPEALRAWFDDHGATLDVGERTFQPDPKVGTGISMAPLTLPELPPRDPRAYTDLLGQIMHQEFTTKPLQQMGVARFEGKAVDVYLINAPIAVGLDDFARSVAAVGETDAIVVMHPGVVELGGEHHRATVCVAECEGRLHARLLALRFGPNHAVNGFRVLDVDQGVVEPGGRWIGVAPSVEMTLFNLDAAES